jgi:hypothetical protein
MNSTSTSAASGSSRLSPLQKGALTLSIGGAAVQAVGAYYGVRSQKAGLRLGALQADYSGFMSDLNARQAELQAVDIMRAGQMDAARMTAQYGEAKAATSAQQASSGVQAGVGSAAERAASIEIAKEIDKLTMDSNTLRQTQAARMQAVNLRNEARFARASAESMRYANRKMDGFYTRAAIAQSLLGGASQTAMQYAYYSRN